MTTASPIRSVSAAERRARLAVRHRLAPSARTDDVVAITESLVALHSSDPATVHLSVAARMRRPAIGPVSTALYDDRTLIRHHAMRRTLWVFTPETARLAHAAATLPVAARERARLLAMLAENGVAEDPAAWLAGASEQTLAALDRLGPSSARQLGEAVPELKAPIRMAAGKAYGTTISAHTRVLLQLGFEGDVVRTRPTGSWINSEYAWASMRSWLPEGITGTDPEGAAAELVRRWLRAFGPATTGDLQRWMGWTMRATRAALAAVEAVAVDLEGTPGWLLPDDLEPVAAAEPWVAFLPGLDPTTMGCKGRGWYLPPTLATAIFDKNGNGGPTVWMDGEIMGGWAQRKDGGIAYHLLGEVPGSRRGEVEAAARALRELIGDARVTARFPAPIQPELLRDA